jgi:hypothetical protein
VAAARWVWCMVLGLGVGIVVLGLVSTSRRSPSRLEVPSTVEAGV